MAYRKFLIAVLALAASSAFAGYAQLSPPSGWSGGSQAMFQGTKDIIVRGAANAPYFQTTASISVGGRAVTVPAAMRMSANAGRFLAGAAFGNPALFAAAVVGSAIYTYYNDSSLIVDGGIWQKRTTVTNPSYNEYNYGAGWFSPELLAASNYYHPLYCSSFGKPCTYKVLSCNNSCLVEVTINATGAKSTFQTGAPSVRVVNQSQSDLLVPVTKSDFEAIMENKPIPLGVPEGWPMALPPLPVDLPIINPSPFPYLNPQPMRVPMGEPQPVPNTDPQKYKSPVIDIVPSPTPLEPWRVDVQPKDIIKDNPTPLPDAEPVPVPNPDIEEVPKPEEPPTQDLCEKNPEILACQNLDEVPDEVLPEIDRDVTITPDGGWGGGSGSCPATKHLTVQGRDIPIPLTLICDYMQGLRPIIIAMAWLSAGFILLGARGGD